MSLSSWVKNGWLVGHQSSPNEIQRLLELADRDLKNSQVAGLDADWRFNIAYNAALQTATAALAASGYRASREAHHYRVIQSLALTIGADGNLVRHLDACRKRRNITSYEIGGSISEGEVEEVVKLARDVRQKAEKWIKSKHPQLWRAKE
jgi:hypothetical protein